MKRTLLLVQVSSAVAVCGVLLAAEPARLAEAVPQHQRDQIEAAAPAKPRVVPRKPRCVLIWITPAHLMENDPHKGYCIPYGAAALTALGRKSGAFETVVSDRLEMYLPGRLRQFDAVFMNNSSGPWITPTDADMQKPEFQKHGADKAALERVLRRGLLDYVTGGGGVVAIHYAIGANRHWPEFQELLGATFTGHPWNEEVSVTVEEPSSPLVAAFDGKDFRLADEVFQYGLPYDRSKVRVLLSLDTERTNMGVKWISREDNDFALAWSRAHGKGRVFYTSFGHRTELYWNPRLLQFYLDAIQFAVGDLEAPSSPRPDWPVRRAPGPTPAALRLVKMKAGGAAEPTPDEVRQMESATPDSAPAPSAKPRKVLVWGRSWAHTPNPFAEEALRAMARKTRAFDAIISDDPRLLLADKLPQFDALVLNNIHERDPFLPDDFAELDSDRQTAARKFDEAVKTNILEYVRGGKGLVGIHAATAAFQNWPEYGDLMGGYYLAHILQEVAIEPEDSGHSVNACFSAQPFKITDEVYIFGEPYSRQKLRVLASLDLDRMPDPGKRPDKDYAVSWVRQYGKGRVFYTTLGHVPQTYWNPVFLRHLLAGIQFSLGDLPGETAPNPR